MSTTEARTRAALHEEADGLLLSDHDLRRLEEDILTLLETRPGERRQGRPARRWGAAAAVALVLGGVALWQSGQEGATPAPVPAGPSQDAEPEPVLFDRDLVGVWRNAPAEPWVWEITGDGRIAWNNSTRDYFAEPRSLERVTARDGEVYEIARREGCRTRLGLRLTGTDSAVATVVGEDCPDATEPGAEYLLERVSGRDPASAPLRPSYPRDTPNPAPGILRISGTWVEPESGTLLVIETGTGTTPSAISSTGTRTASSTPASRAGSRCRVRAGPSWSPPDGHRRAVLRSSPR